MLPFKRSYSASAIILSVLVVLSGNGVSRNGVRVQILTKLTDFLVEGEVPAIEH
jgi:hypothetical protein